MPMPPPTKWTYRITAVLVVAVLAALSRPLGFEVRPIDGTILFFLGLVADLVQGRLRLEVAPTDLPIGADAPDDPQFDPPNQDQ